MFLSHKIQRFLALLEYENAQHITMRWYQDSTEVGSKTGLRQLGSQTAHRRQTYLSCRSTKLATMGYTPT